MQRAHGRNEADRCARSRARRRSCHSASVFQTCITSSSPPARETCRLSPPHRSCATASRTLCAPSQKRAGETSAGNPRFMPSRSCSTRIWPSQPAPAPMPMVGMRRAAGDLLRQAARECIPAPPRTRRALQRAGLARDAPRRFLALVPAPGSLRKRAPIAAAAQMAHHRDAALRPGARSRPRGHRRLRASPHARRRSSGHGRRRAPRPRLCGTRETACRQR